MKKNLFLVLLFIPVYQANAGPDTSKGVVIVGEKETGYPIETDSVIRFGDICHFSVTGIDDTPVSSEWTLCLYTQNDAGEKDSVTYLSENFTNTADWRFDLLEQAERLDDPVCPEGYKWIVSEIKGDDYNIYLQKGVILFRGKIEANKSITSCLPVYIDLNPTKPVLHIDVCYPLDVYWMEFKIEGRIECRKALSYYAREEFEVAIFNYPLQVENGYFSTKWGNSNEDTDNFSVFAYNKFGLTLSDRFYPRQHYASSTHTMTNTDGFSVYPNPVKDVLNIRTGDMRESWNFQILDLSGKYYSGLESRSAESQITVSDLIPGIYILRGESEAGKIIMRRFFKIK